jgi:hypothetical protein
MSEQCHVCGPLKHDAPTVLCAPCALRPRVVAGFYGSGPFPRLAQAIWKIRTLEDAVNSIVNGIPRMGQ